MITALENALIPTTWDSEASLLSVHAKRRIQIQSCDKKHGKQRITALKFLGENTYRYSPRARYINRYSELLLHLKQSLIADASTSTNETARHKVHSSDMAARVKDGNKTAVFTRHRIVPLVMGSAGWVSKALERELQLLFRRGKKNPIGTKLAEKFTIISYDAAIQMYKLWFK
jgi:hypothetical protein